MRGVHVQGTPAVATVQEHHARRRRHGRPRLAARLRQVEPAAASAHHRLDARLVRRVPRAHLLLPRAHRRHRGPVVHHPLQHRLQAGHRAGTVGPADRRLGLRASGQDALSGAGLPGGGHPALSLQPRVHHLRREHRLDHGRRIQLLDRPFAGPGVLGGRCPRPGRWPPPRHRRRIAGRGGGVTHPAVVLRHRWRHCPDPDAIRSPAPAVDHPGVRRRRGADRLLGPAVLRPPAVRHQHGLSEAHQLRQQSLSRQGHVAVRSCRRGSAALHPAAQSGRKVPRDHDGPGRPGVPVRAPGPAVERQGPTVLVPVSVPARRGGVHGGGHPAHGTGDSGPAPPRRLDPYSGVHRARWRWCG